MASKRRRLYLMRHGDVRYVGPDGQPVANQEVRLTDEGRRQSRAVGAALAQVPLDRAVCSGLPRTVETAELVVEGRGLVAERHADLEEIRPGTLRGIPAERLEALFVGSLHAPKSPEDRFLGGETWGSLRARVLPLFRRQLADQDWTHLLMVAHGGVNRVILLEALGGDLTGLGRIEQDPACLNILDVQPDGSLLVRLMNHTCYDTAKAGLVETTMERLYRDVAHLARR
jgi:probable phosphoglycerate mutase